MIAPPVIEELRHAVSEQTVKVRRQWNDHRIATYRIADVHGLHWSEMSGGINARAPREFLSGYVLCDEMLGGELAHSCRHGRPPHQIKVCVTKKDNSKGVYATLLRRMEWEYRFRSCPYMVESRSPTPPSPERLAEMSEWLEEHWRESGYVTIGFGHDDAPNPPDGRLQVWFSDVAIAKAFAAAFGLQARGHQNQEKQRGAAMLMAMPDGFSPIGAGLGDDPLRSRSGGLLSRKSGGRDRD